MELTFKFLFTGKTKTLTISQTSSVLAAKEGLHAVFPDIASGLMKFARDSCSGLFFEDDKTFAECDVVEDCGIIVVQQKSWIIYVKNSTNGQKFSIEIPSMDPEFYGIVAFWKLVQKKIGPNDSLDNYWVVLPDQTLMPKLKKCGPTQAGALSDYKLKEGNILTLVTKKNTLIFQFWPMNRKNEFLEFSEEFKILDAKKMLHDRGWPAPKCQKFLLDPCSGLFLEDDRKFSEYGIRPGQSVIVIKHEKTWNLNIEIPEMPSEKASIEIPSIDPKTYKIVDFREIVKRKFKDELDMAKVLAHFNTSMQKELQDKTIIKDKEKEKDATIEDYGLKEEETLTLVRNICVDLCFLMDCTGSMSMNILVDSISTFHHKFEELYGKDCDIRFAFVGYTDYESNGSSSDITCLDFTSSISAFRDFVSKTTPHGGGDTAEDVMGGLRAVFNSLNWRSSSGENSSDKVLIHIADAPCHGREYHSDDIGDSYLGGDPRGTNHHEMMSRVASLKIHYWFGYINESATNQMIAVFSNALRSNGWIGIRQFSASDIASGTVNAVKECVAAK